MLISRWLRGVAPGTKYQYVTLGGTELRDVLHLHFIDPNLVSRVTTFESKAHRSKLAEKAAQDLQKQGLVIRSINGNIFDYERDSDEPHIFFFDLPGRFAWSDYEERFARLLQHRTVREGDAVFITSILARHSWERVFVTFRGEFNLLEAKDKNSKVRWYRKAHPSFTLYRALRCAYLEDEIQMRCIGAVEYRGGGEGGGSALMGVYGYVVQGGRTEFSEFVADGSVPHFSEPKARYVVGEE